MECGNASIKIWHVAILLVVVFVVAMFCWYESAVKPLKVRIACLEDGHKWVFDRTNDYEDVFYRRHWEFHCDRCHKQARYEKEDMTPQLWSLVEATSGLQRPDDRVVDVPVADDWNDVVFTDCYFAPGPKKKPTVCPPGGHKWSCVKCDTAYNIQSQKTWYFECSSCGLTYDRKYGDMHTAEWDLVEAWCGMKVAATRSSTPVVSDGHAAQEESTPDREVVWLDKSTQNVYVRNHRLEWNGTACGLDTVNFYRLIPLEPNEIGLRFEYLQE